MVNSMAVALIIEATCSVQLWNWAPYFLFVYLLPQFCEFIGLCCLKDLSGKVVQILLDYVSHVHLCSHLTQILRKQKEWADIADIICEYSNFHTVHISYPHSCRKSLFWCILVVRFAFAKFVRVSLEQITLALWSTYADWKSEDSCV